MSSANILRVQRPDQPGAPEDFVEDGFPEDNSSDGDASDTLVPNSPSARQQVRMRQAVAMRREPLPPKQRRYKFGTTSFMLIMHVGAVFALLPRFWSWQALVALGWVRRVREARYPA